MNSIDTILHHIPVDLIEMIICQNKEDRYLYTYDRITFIIRKLDSINIKKRIIEKFTEYELMTCNPSHKYDYIKKEPKVLSIDNDLLTTHKPVRICGSNHCFKHRAPDLPKQVQLNERSWGTDSNVKYLLSKPYILVLMPVVQDDEDDEDDEDGGDIVYGFHTLCIRLNGLREIRCFFRNKDINWSIFDFL